MSGKTYRPMYIGSPDYVNKDTMIDYKTGKRIRILWKKKVYGPDIAIRQEEVDGDPVTMPEIYEWYAYARCNCVNVIKRNNCWEVKLGKDSKPIGFTRAILFLTTRQAIVKTAQKAKDLAEEWLLE